MSASFNFMAQLCITATRKPLVSHSSMTHIVYDKVCGDSDIKRKNNAQYNTSTSRCVFSQLHDQLIQSTLLYDTIIVLCVCMYCLYCGCGMV